MTKNFSIACLAATMTLAMFGSSFAADAPAAPQIDPKKEFTLKLTIGDLQVILASLGNLPYSQAQAISPVLEKIRTQLAPQLPPPPAAPKK